MEETAISLKDIDFLSIMLPMSPGVIFNIDGVSATECIIDELIKFQETPAKLVKTSSKGTNTEASLTCFEIPKINENANNEDRVISVVTTDLNNRSPKPNSAKKTSIPENEPRNNPNNTGRSKRPLTFPPCVICNGKATGLHYGAITCEACKGFFRRHLQKKTDFKCNKEGHCEILSSKKGLCSGCRLKKCLDIGMAKGKSKIGRYSLSKRTEAIVRMNRLDKRSETVKGVMAAEDELDINRDVTGFDDKLIGELVHLMEEIEPYGEKLKTKEQIEECHKHIAEGFKRKVELFGRMGTIPKEEFNKLYKEFGIDIDGRVADMKSEFENFEYYLSRYENFARQIPGFSDLHDDDQTNLLKVAMIDFCVIIANEGYNDMYNTFVSTDKHGYHFEELVDKFYSKELVERLAEMHCRWQDLRLSREETAMLAAVILVSADRCKLQNRALVESMQLSLIELLRQYIIKMGQHDYLKRFAKIIVALTKTREMSELFMKEQNELCNDAVLLEEVPDIVHCFVEDTY